MRRVKESLWSAFSVNRIKPFKDSYTKQQMKDWKQSENVRKVYKDLYKPIDPDDVNGETYISLIIKSIFTTTKEQTQQNGVWVQSVLESIFDERHLSAKIDSEVVDNWTETITDTEMVNNLPIKLLLFKLKLLMLNTLYSGIRRTGWFSGIFAFQSSD